MLIDIIAGARPNFIKISPIINAIKKAKNEGFEISFRLIHTGQHYDKKMSGSFFEELDIPLPDFNFESGSGTQSEQTAKIMVSYEALLKEAPSNLCLVVGDVNSTMACSIAAKKMDIKVAHVEAGIRSGDRSMPEEINRLITDSISDYFFTTTENANENLLREGIHLKNIFFVGNTMIDTLLLQLKNIRKPAIWEEHNLSDGNYFVLTLHRPSNVDSKENLKNLIDVILNGTRGLKVVFPVHPRTAKILSELSFSNPDLIVTDPKSYLEFIYLVKNSKAVITDSGGITEESTVLNIPCMTLRSTTERPETCSIGTNELIGIEPEALIPALNKLFANNWKRGSIPPLWDGKTSERIVSELLQILNLKN
jgi:UDP-N-acetylglucosamine 2-epimerase (non-hydrolysing)